MDAHTRSSQRTPDPSRGGSRPVRFLRTKLLIAVLLCALPAYGVIMNGVNGLSGSAWLPAALYGLMSMITLLLYWHDKRRARAGGQRVPEKLLHGAELIGGWPGALFAQQLFRHKTRKVSYQLVFWLIVVLHELFWMDRLLLGGNFIARHLY